MIHVGIDPGTSGAIAVINDQGELLALRDLPRKSLNAAVDAGAQWRIDGAALYCLLKAIIPAGEPVRVRYEDVQPYNGNIVVVVQMMCAKAAIQTILDCLPGVTVLPVTAAKWKRFFALKKETFTGGKSKQKISSEFKAKSRALAVHLWPEAEIRAVEHTDRAEAALMAEYDRRTLIGTTGDILSNADHNPQIPGKSGRRRERDDESDIPWGPS